MTVPNSMVVDISHHNANPLDFAAAKAAGVVGVIHKVSEGATYQDPDYVARRTAARAVGLLWGAYHFGTKAPVQAQIDNFFDHALIDDQTLLALDFEQNELSPANTMTLPMARQFLSLADARAGRNFVVYGGNYMATQLGAGADAQFGQHRLWWAQYAVAPTIPPTWTSWWLWQHSGDGKGPGPHAAAGIGVCDCDSFAGTAATLAAQWV